MHKGTRYSPTGSEKMRQNLLREAKQVEFTRRKRGQKSRLVKGIFGKITGSKNALIELCAGRWHYQGVRLL